MVSLTSPQVVLSCSFGHKIHVYHSLPLIQGSSSSGSNFCSACLTTAAESCLLKICALNFFKNLKFKFLLLLDFNLTGSLLDLLINFGAEPFPFFSPPSLRMVAACSPNISDPHPKMEKQVKKSKTKSCTLFLDSYIVSSMF